MAKIRVAQIKDLSLTPDTGTQTLTVGANTITPLDEIATYTENADATSFLTGLTVVGNSIVPERKTIASVLATLTGSATIATVADGVVTLKAGVSETNGIISNSTGADITLAKVATTGAAADVSIADAEGVINATTVEGALAEIAKEIDAMDSTFTNIGTLVKVNLTQVDGKVTEFTTDETALNNRLTELQSATTLEGVEAIEVIYGEEANTVSLKIAQGEKVLSQSESGLTSTLNLTYDSTAKAIKLWGISDETPIATVDATDFIKDGMLADAEIITASNEEGLISGKRYIKFTFKTYQQGQEGEADLKVEYLAVENLFDSYTAGNDWIEIDQTTNKISHKTVNGLDSTNAHGITADVTVDSTTTKTFKVPTLTVDAAGHVVSVDEKTVTITLPASIDTAVQTVTSTEAVNTTDKFVAVHATRAEGSNDVVLTSEVETQAVATATSADDGLATALDVKTYVDNAVATASHVHVTEDFVVSDTVTSPFTLPTVPYTGFEVVVYQNGIALNESEYTVSGSTVTLGNLEVALEAGDVIKVSYFKANA